tara:strand:+ start:142 stop:348 length:207 start_codon:yes stop_codon:yes gene_type:complete
MKQLAQALLIVVSMVFLALLLIFPVMWCWNYLMPDLFGLTEITWQQAFVMSILSSLLFKPSNASVTKN